MAHDAPHRPPTPKRPRPLRARVPAAPPTPAPAIQAAAPPPPPPPTRPGPAALVTRSRPGARRLGIVAGALLLVGVMVLSSLPDEQRSDAAELGSVPTLPQAPATTAPTLPPTTAPAPALPRVTAPTTPTVPAVPTVPAAPAAPRPPAAPAANQAGPGVATVDAAARSVVLSGTVRNLGGVDLRGVRSWSTSGRVTDAAGNDLGRGSLRSDQPDVRATGTEVSLGVTFLRIQPTGAGLISSDLMHDSRAGAGHSFTVHGGHAVIEAAGMTFTPFDQEGGATRPVASPVTVTAEYGSLQVDYSGDGITWADMPSAPFPAAVAWLNWAGSGSVSHGGRTYSHEFLGLRGDGDVTVDRSSGAVRLTGTLDAKSVWEDGHARIATNAGVTLKRAPGPIAPGSYGWFTWAPMNAGNFDMAMHRIGPANDQGAWVELRLDPLPDMDGGEDRPRRGADTSGLITHASTKGISSMIRPGKGDERSIKVHVPQGTAPGQYTVSLLVEGNFDPIRVDVPVTVETPAA